MQAKTFIRLTLALLFLTACKDEWGNINIRFDAQIPSTTPSPSSSPSISSLPLPGSSSVANSSDLSEVANREWVAVSLTQSCATAKGPCEAADLETMFAFKHTLNMEESDPRGGATQYGGYTGCSAYYGQFEVIKQSNGSSALRFLQANSNRIYCSDVKASAESQMFVQALVDTHTLSWVDDSKTKLRLSSIDGLSSILFVSKNDTVSKHVTVDSVVGKEFIAVNIQAAPCGVMGPECFASIALTTLRFNQSLIFKKEGSSYQIVGNGGCNRYQSNLLINSERENIVIYSLTRPFMTEMACSSAAMQEESQFLSALLATKVMKFSDNSFEASNDTRSIVIQFRAK